jgi:hypothetical protein
MIATIGKPDDFCERWIARSSERSDVNAPFYIVSSDSTVAGFLPGLVPSVMLSSVRSVAQAHRKVHPMKYPTLYRTTEIDGLSIFYREGGPKDAPTILLLHGLPFSS